MMRDPISPESQDRYVREVELKARRARLPKPLVHWHQIPPELRITDGDLRECNGATDARFWERYLSALAGERCLFPVLFGETGKYAPCDVKPKNGGRYCATHAKRVSE